MDLSGIIFVALALGWAVYLIPKALQRNDELAKTRSVSSFSGRMRVLGSGTPKPMVPDAVVESVAERSLITRQSARRAARRRRQVLLVLVFALGMVGALTGFAIAPLWAPAVPAGLVVVFLVIARLSVRKQQAARRVPVMAAQLAGPTASTEEGTVGVDVSEIRTGAHSTSTVEEAPALVDEGSLWDPLPMTLPTYVTKPTARRTVRTIALTQTTSSGHDLADSKLAREAEAAQKAQKVEQDVKPGEIAAERKVAGA